MSVKYDFDCKNMQAKFEGAMRTWSFIASNCICTEWTTPEQKKNISVKQSFISCQPLAYCQKIASENDISFPSIDALAFIMAACKCVLVQSPVNVKIQIVLRTS